MIDDRYDRPGKFRAIDPQFCRHLPRLASVYEHEAGISLSVVQSALLADRLREGEAPCPEVKLSLGACCPESDERLRLVKQVDDVVRKQVDVVRGLVKQRAERHTCAMAAPFECHP